MPNPLLGAPFGPSHNFLSKYLLNLWRTIRSGGPQTSRHDTFGLH